MGAKRITIHGFLNEFKQRHEQMKDRPFCWVLGSGASVQSQIPTGGALARQWLAELHAMEDFGSRSVEQWATAETLGIPGFTYEKAASFYPWIYQRRFCDYKDEGYAFLESAMDRAEPSFGYSVLAQIMATCQHKVAITTNFDNLIADALSIYTRVFPLVCGHESLTGYVRPNLRRPLVAKIHRDLLLAPLSSPDEIARLPDEWAIALTKIFERFTPIVIGYGGNDGSLMGFLRALPPIEGTVFWCYKQGDGVDSKIDEVVEHHRGRLAPIAGFDEVMLQLQEKLQLPSLLPQLQKVHAERVVSYQKQFESLTAALRAPAADAVAEAAREPARQAAEAAVQRLTKEKTWWAWQLKANGEPDLQKREAIFRAGIEDFPESDELSGNFAIFLHKQGKHDEAEQYYRRALDLEPGDADYLGNYAMFLHRVRRNGDRAEEYFKRALAADPEHANNLGNYAQFLKNVRQDADRAEQYFQRALAADPEHASNLGNYAQFLKNVRRDADRAEEYFKRAIAADPKHASNLGNLAVFLKSVRQDASGAEEYFKRAIAADPKHANNLGNYGLFLQTQPGGAGRVEEYYRRAIEADPKQAINLGNYAQLLFREGRDEEARSRLGEAEANAQQYPGLCAELSFYRLAYVPENWPDELRHTRILLTAGARSPGWDLVGDLERASQRGHPNEKLLAAVARVISENAPLTTLDEFPEWRDAGAPGA